MSNRTITFARTWAGRVAFSLALLAHMQSHTTYATPRKPWGGSHLMPDG